MEPSRQSGVRPLKHTERSFDALDCGSPASAAFDSFSLPGRAETVSVSSWSQLCPDTLKPTFLRVACERGDAANAELSIDLFMSSVRYSFRTVAPTEVCNGVADDLIDRFERQGARSLLNTMRTHSMLEENSVGPVEEHLFRKYGLALNVAFPRCQEPIPDSKLAAELADIDRAPVDSATSIQDPHLRLRTGLWKLPKNIQLSIIDQPGNTLLKFSSLDTSAFYSEIVFSLPFSREKTVEQTLQLRTIINMLQSDSPDTVALGVLSLENCGVRLMKISRNRTSHSSLYSSVSQCLRAAYPTVWQRIPLFRSHRARREEPFKHTDKLLDLLMDRQRMVIVAGRYFDAQFARLEVVTDPRGNGEVRASTNSGRSVTFALAAEDLGASIAERALKISSFVSNPGQFIEALCRHSKLIAASNLPNDAHELRSYLALLDGINAVRSLNRAVRWKQRLKILDTSYSTHRSTSSGDLTITVKNRAGLKMTIEADALGPTVVQVERYRFGLFRAGSWRFQLRSNSDLTCRDLISAFADSGGHNFEISALATLVRPFSTHAGLSDNA